MIQFRVFVNGQVRITRSVPSDRAAMVARTILLQLRNVESTDHFLLVADRSNVTSILWSSKKCTASQSTAA